MWGKERGHFFTEIFDRALKGRNHLSDLEYHSKWQTAVINYIHTLLPILMRAELFKVAVTMLDMINTTHTYAHT